ncbi:peptidase M19 [Sphingomonas oleivorans]|uniref:Peptidase M19 n=1 Tax=Sphingomonas oleivorans TaxID=1735121 RepID=A0A2T5FW41_9SPHN|nr:dipeptidase [Sphingomonas oleivorans]PTQ10001.1 peptidase M19 [Sphingomonas oleivorans]
MHLNSIAFAAGIAILAAPVPAATPEVSGKARAIHERVLTFDTHLDTPANFSRPGWDFAEGHSLSRDFGQVDLPRMKAGGLDGGFFAIYTPQGPRTPEATAAARDAALIRAVEIREMAARLSDKVELAFTADDAVRIAAKGKVVVYQSIENSYPLSADLGLMTTFHELGVRMMSPVHFLNNDFGDSSTDPKGPEWNGLSPLGRRFVAEANRLGIILDASHASDAVLDQMLALSTTPVILSHSGCKAVYDHPRNVDDARLIALAAKGGVIQMNAYAGYVAKLPENPERDAALKALYAKMGNRHDMTPDRVAELVRERDAILARYPGSKPDFDAFMKHMLHALKLVGVDHVGIGLDWDGGGGVEGLEDVVDIPRISAALLVAGYTEADLQKIWSGNVLRVLRAVEAAKAK